MEKIRELLENADGVLAYIDPGEGGRVKTARDFIQKTLALLPPVCKTCKGSGRKPRPKGQKHCRLRLCADLTIPSCYKCQFYIHQEPCPACKQKPEGEFTKELRKRMAYAETGGCDGMRPYMTFFTSKDLEEACNRLDELETELARERAEHKCTAISRDSHIEANKAKDEAIERLKEEYDKLCSVWNKDLERIVTLQMALEKSLNWMTWIKLRETQCTCDANCRCVKCVVTDDIILLEQALKEKHTKNE